MDEISKKISEEQLLKKLHEIKPIIDEEVNFIR